TIVPAYLKGAASVWLAEKEEQLATRPRTWRHADGANRAAIAQTFRTPFINQFCIESRLADWQQELDLHRQGPSDSVEKYTTRFQELIRRVDPERQLPERTRISQFKRGLKPDIQFFVTPARPATLEDAIDVAKIGRA